MWGCFCWLSSPWIGVDDGHMRPCGALQLRYCGHVPVTVIGVSSQDQRAAGVTRQSSDVVCVGHPRGCKRPSLSRELRVILHVFRPDGVGETAIGNDGSLHWHVLTG